MKNVPANAPHDCFWIVKYCLRKQECSELQSKTEYFFIPDNIC